jgi:hypothetical protein
LFRIFGIQRTIPTAAAAATLAGLLRGTGVQYAGHVVIGGTHFAPLEREDGGFGGMPIPPAARMTTADAAVETRACLKKAVLIDVVVAR